MSMVETENALQVAAEIPRDMMLLKLENESIMAVARTEPRDPAKLIAQLQALIDAYPAAANEAIYQKPVGTVTEVTCGNCKITYEVNKVDRDTACPDCESTERGACRPVKKFAEGLSIRAAESIRSIFGFTRLATTCEILADGSARLTGVMVDYTAGNITSDERVVSRHYKSRGGRMVTTPEDRFLNVVVKAEKSKLRRDVILDSTPGIVKAMYRDSCEKKMLELISPEVIKQKILPAFAQYGITPEDLDALIGSPAKLGWNKSQKLDLLKIHTALKAEETTPRELLEGLRRPAAVPTPKGGGVTVEDLTTPQTPPQEPPADVSAPADVPTMKDPLPIEGPEAEAQTPSPPCDPDQILAQIKAADGIRVVNQIQKELPVDLPELVYRTLETACEEQRFAIRASRGGKSTED